MFNYEVKKFYDGAADTIAGISAGSGLIGGIYDAITAQHRASDAMNYGIGMYKLQREDALADWNRQNAYNSPSAIMARYKAAGLNPNLIYGNSGIQSPAIRSSSVQAPVVAPATGGRDVASAIGRYQDTRMVGAQVDQTKQAIANLQSDNLLKQADLVRKQMENVILSYNPLNTTDPKYMDYYKEQEHFRYNMQTGITQEQWNNLTKTGNLTSAQTESQRIQNAVSAATQESNITVGLQRGLQSLIDTAKDKQELENLQILKSKMLNDVELQKLDIQMQAGEFNAKSPLYQKILSGLIDGALLYLGRGIPQQIMKK